MRSHLALGLLVAAAACKSAPVVPAVQEPPPMPTITLPTSPPSFPPLDENVLEQQARTMGFRLGRPGNIEVTPDGAAVLFTRTPPRARVADLYSFDVATGRTTRLLAAEEALAGGGENEQLSDEEKARRERARKSTRGVAGFELSSDGKRVLVALGGSLFVIERAGGAVRRVPERAGASPPIDARFSPDGGRVALVRDGDLYVLDLASGREQRLTQRPSRDVEYGVAEFVAQEEMKRSEGYWWSPDGKQLAYQRSDAAKVDTLYVADPAKPDRAPVAFRYPRVGTANVEVTLGVMPATGGKTVWVTWDRERFPYLARVAWEPNAPMTIVVQNRRQTDLVVLAVNPRTGKTTELLREHDDASINLDRGSDMPRWLPDGSAFLWSSERAGSWQLELRRRDGTLARVVAPPEVGYDGLDGLDEEHGEAWFRGGDDPRQSHVFRAPLDGAPRRVTTAEGDHRAHVGRTGVHVVVSSLADGGRTYEVRRADGSVAGALESVAEAPPYQATVEWTTVEVAGRAHHVSIVRPRAFQPGRRYPVIESVYGGPSRGEVTLDRADYLQDQIYADAGFIVVRADGRGTRGRGRDWERAVVNDLIGVCLADHVAILGALGPRYPELDLTRVGVMGWSFGGYVAAMAVLLQPETYHAAIAGAPVTDWRLYDTHYTERYMGLLDENRAGYDATSALTHADKLSRPLLLIHGTTDDNVYFANSMQLASALFRARKRFELLPLAGITHMVPDPAVKKALTAMEVDFFRRSL